MKLNRLAAAVVGTAVILTASFAVNATHSWANYHWARTTSSFDLQVIDSNTPDWDGELAQTLSDWSASTKLNLSVTGYDDSSRTRRKCAAVSGKIRSCNMAYGNNGWLGLASINISGEHITQGTSKMNDSYSADFAVQNERDHVMCQEIGHLFGLGHTSENGTSQGTCMDYSQSPNSTRPNQHDYDLLVSKYSHLDTTNSYASVGDPVTSAVTPAQLSMAGEVPMGVRVFKGLLHEDWVAQDGKGGIWVHHVTLATGHENMDVLGK